MNNSVSTIKIPIKDMIEDCKEYGYNKYAEDHSITLNINIPIMVNGKPIGIVVDYDEEYIICQLWNGFIFAEIFEHEEKSFSIESIQFGNTDECNKRCKYE